MKIALIGAGIAGLATAVRMASRGHEVQVFEANPYPGGKLSELQLGPYRFDAGPSLFTMPMYVDELFQVAGIDPTNHFSYHRLDTICNYFWEDGTRLSAFADQEKFANEIYNKLGVSPQVIHNAIAASTKKYELTGQIFLEHSLHKVKTWLTKDVAKAMIRIPQLDIFKTMNAVNEQQLKHPKLVQLFNRFATYNGSNPYKASGILNIIPHFEHKVGAFIPAKGMHQITRSIFQLAKEKGVQFNFNTKVEEIIVEGKKAIALKANGVIHQFDTIVSNMDIFYTYKKLLPKEKHPKKVLQQQKSSSALIFYWGIKKEFPALNLHNIFFSDDYKKEFDHIDAGKVYDDPTIYINITKKYCPKDAPAGSENWFTMINVPFNAGQDWDDIIQQSRRQIIKKINRILNIDVQSLIEQEDILDPRTIESKTSSHLGALYGTSSNDRMSAFLRHANFSNRIKNLYFCGGSVHPGGGIPLCLLSAKIVDELIHS